MSKHRRYRTKHSQAPGPGAVWMTPHGVRMRMPKVGSSSPYIRFDYTYRGKRIQTSFGQDWEVAWEEAWRLDRMLEAEPEHSERTVADLAEQWMAVRGPTWQPRYRQENRDYLDQVVLPRLGKIALVEFKREHTRALLATFANPSRVRHVRLLLSAMYNWGKTEGWIPENAGSIVDPPSRMAASGVKLQYKTRSSAPDTDAVLRIVQAATVAGTPRAGEWQGLGTKPFAAHVPLMILTAAFCGLRQGELFELRGRDIQGNEIDVARQVQGMKGGRFIVTAPKNHRTRRTVIPEKVGPYPLRKMLQARADAVESDGLMFPAPAGGWQHRNNFHRQVFGPLKAAAWPGKPWTFHDLRHHFCRWHLDAGVSPADVAEMAGHSSVIVTLTLYVSSNEGIADRVRRAHGQ